jgi:Invasin, domain 3/IPT/TIG domain
MFVRSKRLRRLFLEELESRVVPTLLNKSLFPADYPWNQNIANAPVAANSSAIIAHIGSTIKVHPDWGEDSASNGASPLYGIPHNIVHGNTLTKINVIIDNYPGESDIVPVPIPANAVVEGDYQNGPNPNGGGYNSGQRGDSHLLVWDEDNNIAYELYGVTRPTDPTLFPKDNGTELPHTDGLWHAAQESVWNMNADSFRKLGDTSADAAGLSILAGLARPDEGLPTTQGGQGAINHALRLTLPSGDVSPQYIYPASHVVSDSPGTTKLPFGARLRLMNTPAVNALINTLQPQAQVIAHAMQQYGLVLADIGSAMYVTGTSASEDANNNINLVWNMDDVLTLRSLTAGNFEVVNLAPQVTGLSATSGAPGSTITVIGQNFSGAAGHLKVNFGSTAVDPLAIVDDSHITVVVPNGSGMVDVTVQSGVNKIDPNGANHNVNNPIFGYGTSAVSTADQFTIGGPSISAAKSTFRFNQPVVAAGKSDKVILVVKDSTGNPVSGLTNSAFSFNLSGGTSMGTFGTASETVIPGTYTVYFTGTGAGTRTSLTVMINGITLTTQHTITVVNSPFGSSISMASVLGPVPAGSAGAKIVLPSLGRVLYLQAPVKAQRRGLGDEPW